MYLRWHGQGNYKVALSPTALFVLCLWSRWISLVNRMMCVIHESIQNCSTLLNSLLYIMRHPDQLLILLEDAFQLVLVFHRRVFLFKWLLALVFGWLSSDISPSRADCRSRFCVFCSTSLCDRSSRQISSFPLVPLISALLMTSLDGV